MMVFSVFSQYVLYVTEDDNVLLKRTCSEILLFFKYYCLENSNQLSNNYHSDITSFLATIDTFRRQNGCLKVVNRVVIKVLYFLLSSILCNGQVGKTLGFKKLLNFRFESWNFFSWLQNIFWKQYCD